MIISSGYLFGRQMTAWEPPAPPYPFYWWNSPGVCPVREVNGYKPSMNYDTSQDPDSNANCITQIDTSNKYYSGGDIGCNALEITDDLPWGYDNYDHDYEPYRMAYYIPLYDASGHESTRYMLVFEILVYYLIPYVDENNKGEYFLTSQMLIYDREAQEVIVGRFVDSEGVFKPSGNHIYMFAGADTFYYHETWTGQGEVVGSVSNYVYSGLIVDACHNYGYDRVKWQGVCINLKWIDDNIGMHLDPDWFNPS